MVKVRRAMSLIEVAYIVSVENIVPLPCSLIRGQSGTSEPRKGTCFMSLRYALRMIERSVSYLTLQSLVRLCRCSCFFQIGVTYAIFTTMNFLKETHLLP